MSARYDSALTVFSPDGHLFQVEYALEAVRMRGSAIGVRCKDAVILTVEKRVAEKLQKNRTLNKIAKVDDHIMAAIVGLAADARVLINRARVQCQSHRLTVEDAPTVEHITRWMAQLQQRYTQRGGVRPFGVSCLLAGFNPDGSPQLYKTDPSGFFSAWKAAAVGKSDDIIKEFLERAYKEDMTREEGIQLAVKAIMEVVDSGGKNLEVVVITKDGTEVLEEDVVTGICEVIDKEKEEEARKKKAEAQGAE